MKEDAIQESKLCFESLPIDTTKEDLVREMPKHVMQFNDSRKTQQARTHRQERKRGVRHLGDDLFCVVQPEGVGVEERRLVERGQVVNVQFGGPGVEVFGLNFNGLGWIDIGIGQETETRRKRRRRTRQAERTKT